MKKTAITALLVMATSSANASPNMQGYYQSKELINYAVNKIQQNKAEYFMLDYALTLPASNEAQIAEYNTAIGYFQAHNTDVSEDVFINIVNKVNPSALDDQFVCRVDIKGTNHATSKTKLAYIAKRGQVCDANYDSEPRAISQVGTKISFFRRWDFDPTSPHFDIQSYDIDELSGREVITQDYFLKFEGHWIGTSVRVIKADVKMDSGHNETSYDVASYRELGARIGQIPGGNSLLYSDHPYFVAEDNLDSPVDRSVKAVTQTTFNTVSIIEGPYNGRNLHTEKAHYEINRDYVKPYLLDNLNTLYLVSDPQFFAIDSSLTGPYDSSVWRDETSEAKGGDWVAHAFNNTHNIVSFSPTYCMIEDIAEGRPVIEYLSADGDSLFNPAMDKCQVYQPGTVAKEYTHFTNADGIDLAVESLRQSAKDIIDVRTQHPQGNEALLTVDDVNAMLDSPRYQDIKKELSQRYSWSKPYDILK
ncbi:porin [Photobacterium rosenbergii]|uniref:Porin n=1 Tax=Photobacterium rosenbergii TaxID=294936 RepID=A0A2T3NLI4_9GAMM|nr:porin [Photobacterium rosenbergii]PSW16384.1 porin [Photobacterium rosenbergii]